MLLEMHPGRSIAVIVLYAVLLPAALPLAVVVSGPGLVPDKVVLPARYFFVNITHINEHTYSADLTKDLEIDINGKSENRPCRIWVNKLDRKDGTFIVRYKTYETCTDFTINIYYKKKHIHGSPFEIKGEVQADQCDCPERDLDLWLKQNGCPESYDQIDRDLKPFQEVDMNIAVEKIVQQYHQPLSTSFCHYVLKDNLVHRKCYGEHVGFNMFSDNVLLWLARRVRLPDVQLVMNLGDWPLVKRGAEPLPVWSWCGSRDTLDVLLPTYDLTESTLENMGRVMLDTLSVQGNVERAWAQRDARAFWRGRDSRAERLALIDIARAHPDLFNASLTNFFFFRDKEAQYGPKQPHESFYKFFNYKYQVNVDGTVAAYRLAYLLAGGGLVLKQESPFYEHFYSGLRPWEHYVPVARDLSDLVERVHWAREHDAQALDIARAARRFANDHLLPLHVLCYHAVLLREWSRRLRGEVRVRADMEHVPQRAPDAECRCAPTGPRASRPDEL